MPKSCQNGCGRWVQSDTRTALRSRCMRNPLCAITSECSEMTREEISNASGKPAIEVSVLLQYVLSRATKLILELRKLFFDTQDCQLFGRDTQAVRSFLQFRSGLFWQLKFQHFHAYNLQQQVLSGHVHISVAV